jgi:hypothetical protein
MPAVSISPSEEACAALVDQINGGTAYTLAVNATTAEQFSDEQEFLEALAVDVVPLEGEQLHETLAVEDRSSHQIGIEIRRRLESAEQNLVNDMKLIVQQIFQRVNNFDSSNRRVRVWECSPVSDENPNKELLSDALVFRSRLMLRVEVEPPA